MSVISFVDIVLNDILSVVGGSAEFYFPFTFRNSNPQFVRITANKSRSTGKSFTALILYGMKKKYRILLKDFLLMAELKREEDLKFSDGEQIQVKIKRVDPQNDMLKLEYAGKI